MYYRTIHQENGKYNKNLLEIRAIFWNCINGCLPLHCTYELIANIHITPEEILLSNLFYNFKFE